VLVLGCATNRTSLETLEKSLLFFHEHVRARDVEAATKYVAVEAIEKFMSLHDPDRNIYIMEDYSIKNMVGDPGSDRMDVHIKVHARRTNSITIETIRYHEVWEKRDGSWMMIEEEIVESGSQFERMMPK